MSEFVTLEIIDEAFRAHGIVSHVANSCVQVGSSLRVRASTQVHTREPDRITIQLDVWVAATGLGSSNPIVDSFAGVGATEIEAEKNAYSKFLLGSFHVIAESLTTHQCESEQVEWEDWNSRNSSWRVCSGPLLTQATTDKTESQYGEVLTKIQDQFLRQAEPGAHWMRIFLGFLNGKLDRPEAILDGEEWGEAQEILGQAAWAPGMGYESLRHLLVALPVAESGANRMNTGNAIEMLMAIVVMSPTADDGEIVDALVGSGLSEVDAERVVAFVPMACGRAVLAGMGARFPDTYLVRDHASGREKRGRIADEPTFREAQAFVAKRGVSSEAVRILASRSAEMNGARKLLGTGGSLGDIRFTETILLRLPIDAVRSRRWWQW